MREIVEAHERLLEVREALALQSLIMRYALPRATKIKDLGGMYRFTLYKSPGPEVGIGSGEHLTLMGVCLGRTMLNTRTMRVSFLHMDLTPERRFSNYRELYRLDWMTRKDYCIGTMKTYSHHGEIQDSFVDDAGLRQSEVVAHISKEEYPMSIEHCDELAEKLLETTQWIAV